MQVTVWFTSRFLHSCKPFYLCHIPQSTYGFNRECITVQASITYSGEERVQRREQTPPGNGGTTTLHTVRSHSVRRRRANHSSGIGQREHRWLRKQTLWYDGTGMSRRAPSYQSDVEPWFYFRKPEWAEKWCETLSGNQKEKQCFYCNWRDFVLGLPSAWTSIGNPRRDLKYHTRPHPHQH